MNRWVVAALLVSVLTVAPTQARKRLRHHPNEDVVDQELESNEIDDDDAEVVVEDPCDRKHCGAGQECRLDELGEPHCQCVSDCAVETDPRRKVCSNHNSTWDSDCELYRMRCWCKHEDKNCAVNDKTKESYKHMHIEYYGDCKEMQECSTGQMADFPRRMRDWLFNIMRDMAEREELSPHYLKMEKEAEMNLTRRWTNAAIWKWCDLDESQDRSVSRHELFPIKAPLMALEHCIAPFFDSCDTNKDHLITLKEWAKCLELSEDDIEDRCDDIRQKNDEA